MLKKFLLIAPILFVAYHATAQGIMGDVLSGKLIHPEVGAYAWYDLTDTSTGKQFYLRLAVVDEERVRGKTGHWFEVELLPRVGFPAIYKLLLTGPASDPRNVHRIVMQEGANPPVELDSSALSGDSAAREGATRTIVGEDEVATLIGTVIAEHARIEENGAVTDIWLNDEIRPMGLVKIKNEQGELVLRNYGQGGEYGGSAMDRSPITPIPGVEPVNTAPSVTVETLDEPMERGDNIPPLEEIKTPDPEPLPEPDLDPVPESEPETPQQTQSPNVISTPAPQESVEAQEETGDESRRAAPRRPNRGFGARPR